MDSRRGKSGPSAGFPPVGPPFEGRQRPPNTKRRRFRIAERWCSSPLVCEKTDQWLAIFLKTVAQRLKYFSGLILHLGYWTKTYGEEGDSWPFGGGRKLEFRQKTKKVSPEHEMKPL